MTGFSCVQGHTVFVRDRGGMDAVGPGVLKNLASVRWSRDRDSISEADIVITGDACREQADFLGSLEPHRHELVIFRGRDRVWEGPIWRINLENDEARINAHDVLEYLFWRPLTKKWSNAYPNSTEVTTRMMNIITYEMQTDWTMPLDVPVVIPAWENVDPPANVLPYVVAHHFPNEASTSAVTQAYAMSVGEHLQYTARHGGIDFATIGRGIHIWDTSRHIAETRTLTDADFLSGNGPIVSAYGADHTVNAVVSSTDGKAGFAATDGAYYGPWTKIFTVYDQDASAAPSQAELNSQAQRNTAGRNPVPVEVRIPDGTSIRLNETLTINDLVPGARVPVLATLNARPISQNQKLDKLVVTETAEGETVQVTLTPATRPDSDEEE